MFSIDDIINLLSLEHEIYGLTEGKAFNNAKPIQDADHNSIVWVSPKHPKRQILAENTQARIIICDDSVNHEELVRQGKCVVKVKNPRIAFIRLVEGLFKTKVSYGVHPTAFLDPEARIDERVFVGPFTYVGKSSVGNGSVIYGHCHIYDGVQIGKNVTIHAGTVIGSDGFGYSRNEGGEFEKFPHIGGVTIEDGVEIGANTCIDRGTLGNTLIQKGAKIDNLVHIAHNVVVGAHSAVIAHAMVGGSTVIGDHAWVAPSVSMKEGLNIGGNAVLGLGAVVLKDVPDNETWIGNPARPMKEYLKMKNMKEKK